MIPLFARGCLIFITLSKATWKRRAAMLGIFLVSYALIGQACQQYFRVKHNEAVSFVHAAGGSITPRLTRAKWFAVWAGLGDFDEKYGFLWDDRAVSSALEAIPPGRSSEDTLRNDVLLTIVKDPTWYARILAKRVWRILAENTPVSIAFGSDRLTLISPGFVVALISLFVPALLVVRQEWFFLKALIFPSAIALTPLLVYSGHGVTYYSTVHLFSFAILVTLTGRIVSSLVGKISKADFE